MERLSAALACGTTVCRFGGAAVMRISRLSNMCRVSWIPILLIEFRVNGVLQNGPWRKCMPSPYYQAAKAELC